MTLVELLRASVAGAAGDSYAIAETLLLSAPIALIALGAIPSLRAGYIVVGGEGQLAMGALAATACALALPTQSRAVLFVAPALCGAAGGAAWALLPAWLRVRRGVSEILSTLMLNYVAAAVLLATLLAMHADSGLLATAHSETWPDAARLPVLWPSTRLHVGVLLILFAAFALRVWLHSAAALRVRVLASSIDLGRRLGAEPHKVVGGSFAIAGAAAGLAGWMQVAGLTGMLYPSVSAGIGFLGLLAALLGRSKPLPTVLAAVLFAALITGAESLQVETGISSAASVIVQGVLFIVLALSATRTRVGSA